MFQSSRSTVALCETDFEDRVHVPEFAVYCGAVRD